MAALVAVGAVALCPLKPMPLAGVVQALRVSMGELVQVFEFAFCINLMDWDLSRYGKLLRHDERVSAIQDASDSTENGQTIYVRRIFGLDERE